MHTVAWYGELRNARDSPVCYRHQDEMPQRAVASTELPRYSSGRSGSSKVGDASFSVAAELEPRTTSLPIPQATPKVANVPTKPARGVAIPSGTPLRAYSSKSE